MSQNNITKLPPTFFAPPHSPYNWTVTTGPINHASLSGLGDDQQTQYISNKEVKKKKCDEMGCKDGKILLLHSKVDCKKCSGTGEIDP